MNNKVILLAVGVSIFIIFKSCVNHEFSEITETVNTDESLIAEINEGGYQYYQNGTILAPASASPHGLFKLRFNAIAWSSLDGTGELPVNGRFKEGSVIVKEVYQNNSLILYAVIKKLSQMLVQGMDGFGLSIYWMEPR